MSSAAAVDDLTGAPPHQLSGGQLVEQVRCLAEGHRVHSGRQAGKPLLRLFRKAARDLVRAYRDVVAAAGRREPLSPAAEWLFDNFHLVEEQLASVRKHLPREYYAELPKLAAGPFAGYPRVFALAHLIVSHSDGALDERALLECVAEYQRAATLTAGELWAVPIMLRVALLANLARLAAPLEERRRARRDADAWADRLLLAVGEGHSEVPVMVGELAGRRESLSASHLVRLLERLRGRGAALAPVLDWLAGYVREKTDATVDDFVRLETHLQAAEQVSISNSITSFRLLSHVAWNEFFEASSGVHGLLSACPAYADADFATRDACRHAVERVARCGRRSETDVAAGAVEAAGILPAGSPAGARESPAAARPARECCVPFHLIDDGVFELERRFDCTPTARERAQRLARRRPELCYFGSILSVTALLTGIAAAYAVMAGASWPLLLLTLVVALIPASDLGVGIVNWVLTHSLPPHVLPKLDFRAGIPARCRTLVAVPTLLSSATAIDELIARLEVHYLANPDPSLGFALLTDFTDCDSESSPGDEALLLRAVEGILELGARHETPDEAPRFFLFHRKRVWNETQQCWMGWERKRGKLMELNRLLRGDADTTFTVTIGDVEWVREVRYVLTLDSDTRLPADAAHRLVGTLAHPLNAAVIDPDLRRVVKGYAILQPRISITLTSAARSLFTRIFSGNAGVDPYTTAASDVYQDLFGEGVFCGKGLYEVDAFETVLAGRVAENTLLSHDLFEGSFARCGLVTDVELFDDYPIRYDSFSARQHRWIRGDWQLLRWLMPRVRPPAGGRWIRSPLSLLSRWKMLDNLRRSLVAPGLLLFLAAGWLALPGSGAVWTAAALAAVAFPILAHVAGTMLVDPRVVPWGSYFWSAWIDLRTNLAQVALSLAFLAHQALVALDAVARTLWRLFVRRRSLLEWQTAAEADRGRESGPAAYWMRMGGASAVALVLLAAVAWLRPDHLALAAPLLVFWALSPALAYEVSRPARVRLEILTSDERLLLREIARKTWRFFEESVGADDHWLPPDNVQPDRPEPVAHRTSPTNIGLLLLSTVAARDLGYVGLLELVERLERTLASLSEMERHRGHFYNWYETRGPSPIPPFYISAVDSGNLAGHLLVAKQALLELREAPVFSLAALAGLEDTVRILRSEVPAEEPRLRRECDALLAALQARPAGGPGWALLLGDLRERVAPLCRALSARTEAGGEERRAWCRLLSQQLEALERDVEVLVPWGRLLLRQPEPFGDGALPAAPSVRRGAFEELTSPPEGVQRGVAEITDAAARALAEADRLRRGLETMPLSEEARVEARAWLTEVLGALESGARERAALLQRIEAAASLCGRLVDEMDFSFLYDEARGLFVVGYDVADARMDASHYDLLASESRLGSFVAIAKGDVPQKHWFRLGRGLTVGRGERALLSWGGTMFEYLMPLLVMRAYPGTLVAETLCAVVRRQQRFAAREGVPWGFSESGFAARDPQKNYQYRTFGVPGLGLKPDLFEDLVVSPYATLLALGIAPKAALHNLELLTGAGMLSGNGFFEAIDYTPSRLQPGHHGEVVRQWMAHHQGMALVSIDNALCGSRMQQRFHADPLVRAAELLLEERNPRAAGSAHPVTQQAALRQRVQREVLPGAVRHYSSPNTSTPRVQLLSNGHYSVLVTAAGGGYSHCDGMAVTRWREDATRDHWGQFLYLRDVAGGECWSIAHQPICSRAGEYDVYFTEDKVELRRRWNGILATLEIAVSPEDNAEIRRVTLANTGALPRELEIVSYAEVVLARPAADRAHAAFSNLFVETEFAADQGALLATRRPRAPEEPRPWAVHLVAHEGLPTGAWSETGYETDRGRFLGRGRTPAAPAMLDPGGAPSRSVGSVLDPIFSLTQRVRIGPGETVQLAFVTAVAATRADALDLAERYRDLRISARTFELAWMHTQIELRHLNLTPDQASACQRLASRLIYVDPFVRAPEEVLARNLQGQSALWAYGISGDLPIALAQVSSFEHLPLVRELLLAHSYLRRKGLAFDLVILNEHPPSYLQPFEEALQDAARNEGAPMDQPGGVFLRRAELIPDAGRTLLQFVARAAFSGMHGALSAQLDWRPEPREPAVKHRPSREPGPPNPRDPSLKELAFFNGLGGFSAEGQEYTMLVAPGAETPAPWSNVVANRRFGFLATESGLGCTWSENSRENRLTPWSNDPVSDPPGEAIYLRNESTGRVWSATPLPSLDNRPYLVHHGPGYTRYEHQSRGVELDLLVFVPVYDPVKIYRLRLRNETDRAQELTVTFYAEWVLGVSRDQSQAHVFTLRDPETGALFARNSYSAEFAGRVAFADVDQAERTWTADRTEFLGRNGSPAAPRAMANAALGGACGAAVDPCAAIRVRVLIEPGSDAQVAFTLGQGVDAAEAQALVRKYRNPAAVEEAERYLRGRWSEALSTVQVRTPDPALDLLLNRWLLYQVLACRLWGRSAFYQSGGAFGFRDQLQDVMALITSGSPGNAALAREQILLHATHQFVEGDVQHWWHPPAGRGTRTRFSDDLLWLPYVTAYYVRVTGDARLLDEAAPFLEGRPLAEGEDEYYDLPQVSSQSASVYEHCLRAIRRGMTTGAHGLPLMGSGDWNDGMNRVGHEGRGESVWVAWFLISVLEQFAPICAARGDGDLAAELTTAAGRYREAAEAHAWDGAWYRRAYFDDGTPLGSASSAECQIDSISQTWAVISGAGDPGRSRRAMESVEERLVREDDGLILLFTPPFDAGTLEPGYIKGYVPGVRENGGQYTHAALWTVMATAMLGHGTRAHELLALLNPIRHSATEEQRERYVVEPYVVAADVYGEPPHTGRGGWTWYTGSASWMYRIGLETLLGLRIEGTRLTLDPCIPAGWAGFELTYTRARSRYRVRVTNPDGVERGVRSITLDGEACKDRWVPLADDGGTHEVQVVMG